MAYKRLNLKNGDVLTEEHLKHIEDGIEEAGSGGGSGDDESATSAAESAAQAKASAEAAASSAAAAERSASSAASSKSEAETASRNAINAYQSIVSLDKGINKKTEEASDSAADAAGFASEAESAKDAAKTAQNNAEESATKAAQFAQAATNMANSAADATFNARNAQTAAENAECAAASSATTAQNAATQAQECLTEVETKLANGEFDGADGQRGTGILNTTTGIAAYTTAVGGVTPAYRILLSTLKTQSKVDEVLVGDTVRYSYYVYPVIYVDSEYAYLGTRVSIRGATGAKPTKGTDYWTDADKAEMVSELAEQAAPVSYAAQTLTEEQKAQARANIGAMGDTDMGESETLQVVYTTSYPNTTTFAYTETTTENYCYCLAKPSEVKGGLLTVDYDPAEIPDGAAGSFQLNILLFDEDGNPYKHTGSKTTWGGENVEPTYHDPGAGQSYGTVTAPFTAKIPNGCTVMVTVRNVTSGDAAIGRAFNKWVYDGGVTFTVSTGSSPFMKRNVGAEYAGQYLVVNEKGDIVPSAEGGGGATALSASINPNIKSVNHRGFGTAPENTLAAFRLSKKMGFEIAECDVRMTSDGHYVLLHDTTVDRTSEGTGAITSLTFDYVRGLDFGSYKSAEYAGEQIPTFDECMKLCRDIGLQMYIDMKISSATQAIVNELVNTVKKYRMLDKVTWISHKADLTLVRNADPSARLALIAEDVNSTTITNATALKNDANEVIIDAGYSYITDDMVVLCQDADIPLEIYGLDTAAAIIASNSYISGFTTDTVIAGVELYKAAMDL